MAGKREMKKALIIIVWAFSGILSFAHADCYLVYSSKVTSSLGGPGRHGPIAESECTKMQEQQASLVGSSNVRCECTSGSSSGGSSSTGGYSGKNTMQYQMMQGIGNAIGEGIRQGLENARLAEIQRVQEAKRQEELKKQEEKRKNDKARGDWKKLKLKEAQAALKEKERANVLSQQMGDSSGSMQIEPIGGGSSFFGSGNSEPKGIEFKPIENAKYDASKLTSLARAMCSASFMNQASSAKDLVQVQYYNNQAGKVMAGEMYDEECKISVIPEPPEPEYISSSEEGASLIKRENIIQEIEQNVKQLAEISTKLQKNGDDIKAAETKKEKAEAVNKEIQMKAQTTTTPEQQRELDALVDEAKALASEAEADLQIANSTKEKLLSEEREIQQGLQVKYNALKEQPSTPQSKGETNEKP